MEFHARNTYSKIFEAFMLKNDSGIVNGDLQNSEFKNLIEGYANVAIGQILIKQSKQHN